MDSPIAIIIPNYNGRRLLARYLPAVAAAGREVGARVIIADDASTDDGPAWVRENFPEVAVRAYPDNRGFAGNVNRAVRDTDSDYIVLLNSDVEPDPGFARPLLERLRPADVFAAVPVIREAAGEIGFNRLRFRRGMLDFVRPAQRDLSRSPAHPAHAAYACGAAMAFPREKFLLLGGYDEIFSPYYGEDLDLSYRAWKRGWRIVFEPASRVFHQHSATIGADKTEKMIRRIKTRQYLIFQWKNLSDPDFIARHLFFLPWRLLFYAAYPGRWPEGRGMIEALKYLPAAWKARSKFPSRLKDREALQRINSPPDAAPAAPEKT